MKKLLALTVVSLMSGTAVFAKGGNHPMSGCGLAYVLFAHQDKRMPVQVLAATTNGSFGNQTFGMTTGTLGCTERGTIARGAAAEIFADVNLRQLSRDMSMGEGEYLAAFSQILGIDDGKRAAFNQMVKENYTAIFPTASTTAVEMIQNLNQKMAEHRHLLS